MQSFLIATIAENPSRYIDMPENIPDPLSPEFQAWAKARNEEYEEMRREYRRLHPHVTTDDIEANLAQRKIEDQP